MTIGLQFIYALIHIFTVHVYFKIIKMFNKIVLSVAMALCISATSNAQLDRCSTDEHYHKIMKEYPQLAEYEKQFDGQVEQRVAEKTSSIAATDTTIFDIPLVIHVVHDYGGENIPDTILYDAAAYWAVVYMEQNEDTVDVITPFKPYVGNPRIRLHLATIDPNGKPTKGIVRFQSYLTNVADDQAKFGQWPPTEYVNVWFIGTFGAEDAGAAAYAYYPSSAAFMPYYDGVIGLSTYANYDKAIPHEIGHVLNLEHPWGNTNAPGVACGDDGVDDTPPTMGHEPTGCTPASLYDVTCAVGYSKTYLSSDGTIDSVVHYPDTTNSQNIMDYTYCQKMFTKGQVFRMRTALTGTTAGRNNLITPANLAATGALQPMPDLPPVADYIVNKALSTEVISDSRSYFLTINNPGAQFSFRNTSWNDTISAVAWAFSNGPTTPTSTSTGYVTSNFSVPGWVTVTLVATSNAGSDTLVNTHAVYAADTAVAGGIGYTQPFASAASISNWPMFNFYNNQFQWEFFTGASHSGSDNSCIRYRSFDTSAKLTGNPTGDHDDIYTPAFDLTGTSPDLYLNFYTAGAKTTSGGLAYGITPTNDSLEVDVTVSGGDRWVRLESFNSAALVNNGVSTAQFVPTASSQWASRAVAVPAAYRTNNTFFRLRYWPGNTGNNLYLDDLSLGAYPAGVAEVLNTPNTFNIYPNPAVNGCNIVFKTGNDGVVDYMIKDVTGKLVYQAQKTFAPNSVQQEAISRSATPAAGMYFVTVTIDGVHMTQKLVVY